MSTTPDSYHSVRWLSEEDIISGTDKGFVILDNKLKVTNRFADNHVIDDVYGLDETGSYIALEHNQLIGRHKILKFRKTNRQAQELASICGSQILSKVYIPPLQQSILVVTSTSVVRCTIDGVLTHKIDLSSIGVLRLQAAWFLSGECVVVLDNKTGLFRLSFTADPLVEWQCELSESFGFCVSRGLIYVACGRGRQAAVEVISLDEGTTLSQSLTVDIVLKIL